MDNSIPAREILRGESLPSQGAEPGKLTGLGTYKWDPNERQRTGGWGWGGPPGLLCLWRQAQWDHAWTVLQPSALEGSPTPGQPCSSEAMAGSRSGRCALYPTCKSSPGLQSTGAGPLVIAVTCRWRCVRCVLTANTEEKMRKISQSVAPSLGRLRRISHHIYY